MPKTIATFSDPLYTQLVPLDGTNYGLTFRFNEREVCWYLHIASEEGDQLADGIKLVCNWPLLVRFGDPNLPPGELIAAALGPDVSPPGLLELGEGLRAELTYFTAEDVINL